MSPSLSPIVFQRKQVVSLSGGTEFNTKISPDRSPIIFVAYSKAVSLIANRIVRNNQVIYSFGGRGSDSSATIYVFSKGIAKKETWGMSFFNAQGGEIYNTANIPLSFTFLNNTEWNSSGGHVFDYPPAIIPTYANVFAFPVPGGAMTMVYGYAAYGNTVSSIFVNQLNGGHSFSVNGRVPVINRNLYN
ncbi:hypothetical protein ABEL38_13395 [Escherichia coli]